MCFFVFSVLLCFWNLFFFFLFFFDFFEGKGSLDFFVMYVCYLFIYRETEYVSCCMVMQLEVFSPIFRLDNMLMNPLTKRI